MNDLWDNDEGDGNCYFPDDSNIHADPLFCNPEGGDYSLREDCPCLAHRNAVQCRSYMGAYDRGCGVTEIERSTWGRLKVMYR